MWTRTNIMGFIEHHNRILRHLLRDLLSYLWIQQVVKRIYDNVYKWHLKQISFSAVVRCQLVPFCGQQNMGIFPFHDHIEGHLPRSKYQEGSSYQVRASLNS